MTVASKPRLVFNNPRMILPDHTYTAHVGVARRLLDRLNAARAEHRTTCAGSTKRW